MSRTPPIPPLEAITPSKAARKFLTHAGLCYGKYERGMMRIRKKTDDFIWQYGPDDGDCDRKKSSSQKAGGPSSGCIYL